MGSTEAQGAAPEKEKRETVGAWGGAGESEVIQRRVGKRRRERGRRQAQRSVRLNTTSVAGLRDEGGLPTFSVRQQELGGKANLDGPDVSLPRSMKTVTGPNWLSGRLSSGLQRPRYQG